MKYFIIALFTLCLTGISAQITGTIYGVENGKKTTLPGASIVWQGTTEGTVSNPDGIYTIEPNADSRILVVTFVGYKAESRSIISRQGKVDFTLKAMGSELQSVDVVGERRATGVDLKSAGFTLNIDEKELRKAACCNLSESFETNASVDVSFTDAVTGQKQIEMLGLSGKYALIQRENIPYARGLNATTGLNFIPGPFVQSLQVTKGLSSVINGYESITGQINVEYVKPETAPKLLVNAFANAGGRAELNGISRFKLNEATSTALLVLASTIAFAQDRNNDGFADIPISKQLNITNRYHWKMSETNWEGQFGYNLVLDEQRGGQVDFINDSENTGNAWGYTSNNNRYEVYGKNGYVFENSEFRSLGIIFSANFQSKEARFGDKNYEGTQLSGYLNTIYADILGNLQHKFRTGVSFQMDDVSEFLDDNRIDGSIYDLTRTEAVPGAYFEYTYEPSNRLTLVSGIRADYNSYFDKAYITPRLNLRYMPADQTTLRIGGGRGQRTPLVAAENLSILASNRVLNYTGVSSLLPEVAWNSGASITQLLEVGSNDHVLTLTADAFYTWFDTKLVADLDVSPQEAVFLLNQGSRSFSLLTQADYELFENFDVRLAYKYLDAQEQFTGGLAQSYLIPKHRAFINLAYKTENKWKFDVTTNWFGEKRLPVSVNNPIEFQQTENSPSFITINSQINKEFKNGLEIFVGVDNLLNFRQDNPIVNPNDPSSVYFDTNYTWGPIFGRNIYAGLYYTIE